MSTGEVCGAVRTRAVAAACGVLVMSLSACGGWGADGHGVKGGGPGNSARGASTLTPDPRRTGEGAPSSDPGPAREAVPSSDAGSASGAASPPDGGSAGEGAQSSDAGPAGGGAPSSDAGFPGGTSPIPADPSAPATSAPPADPERVPGVGDRLHRSIPDASRQVLAVYGDGEGSPDCTLVLYEKGDDDAWNEIGRWRGHNGRRGWTADHHEDDLRTPVGVFSLSDAGGVLDDPGTRLPYDQGRSYEVPAGWGEAHRHDFDYVIAIDYNRLRGTPPNDPTRPQGDEKGGGIWLHVDHRDGTSACVTLPESGMEYLLRTLDPAWYPVVVMGDREALKA